LKLDLQRHLLPERFGLRWDLEFLKHQLLWPRHLFWITDQSRSFSALNSLFLKMQEISPFVAGTISLLPAHRITDHQRSRCFGM
jgi:hypothetical protein